MNGLDLFSGIGGITLALAEWVEPIAYCENEPYAQAVLLSRMESGDIPPAPIWDDVKTLKAENLPSIDIIYGGFPCQDISCAGLRKGLAGKRSGLFFEVVRLVGECKPAFVFLENVPAIKKYRPEIFEAFKNLGYDCRDGTLAAAHFNAPHIRNRWFFLAHSQSTGLEAGGGEESTFSGSSNRSRVVSNSKSTWELQRRRKQQSENREAEWNVHFWESEPNVGRVANGIRNRVDRVKSLGNSVVPECAKEAFKRLTGIE